MNKILNLGPNSTFPSDSVIKGKKIVREQVVCSGNIFEKLL